MARKERKQRKPAQRIEETARPAPSVVGIGASAGGLSALKAFFEQVPADSGLAFVVVVHLSPEHESHLADLLQPHVRMSVEQVQWTTPLQPNRVYVIPPGRNLSAIDSHLRLSSIEERRVERAPIDHFFRTLAATHDGQSIGIVLTGTGSDGALGIKAIKEQGGLTLVQDPDQAEYDGMPRSALATGLVDLVLPVVEMPAAILRFARTTPRLLAEDEERAPSDRTDRLVKETFGLVRASTGRDFGRYKRSTVMRRIGRRMQLHHVEELADYVQLLRDRKEEVRALADDLLINVTNFFRDPETFDLLRDTVIPALFEGKGPEDDIRVWCVGCATGEEAYSLAILLLEHAGQRDVAPRLQVFASDLHEPSLERAREGIYTGDIAVDLGAERLQLYFTPVSQGYRIRKEVREIVVFTPHNLLGDPPFSRLDLISCRNVLIYLQREAQREVMELFHYALRADGHLMLGSSETLDGSDLFYTEDKQSHLYRRRDVPVPQPRLPVFPTAGGLSAEALRSQRTGETVAYGALHQRMVERYAPPSLLVSPDDKVVHLSQHAGRYLALPGGELTANAVKLVREELRVELRAALQVARERNQPLRSKPVALRLDGQPRLVVLDVRPALEPAQQGFALIIFDERLLQPGDGSVLPDGPARQAQDGVLESELNLTRQRLQALIEEYETGQEEMRASNEELQSTNEELRSTLEELETSKEELQSMNEELQTVNQENRHKVEELAQLSNDLQNLLVATDIATLFLDRELRIMRFTPKLEGFFNVRATDRGRPISDLTHSLGYDDLAGDAENVLARLVPIEREVSDKAGRWYLTRVRPYRASDDRIAGVVITFVEITARKLAEDALRESDHRKEEFLAMLAHEMRNPLAALRTGLALLEAERTGSPSVDETREMMERQVAQLVRMITDLLDVERITHDKLELRRARIDLASVVRQAFETLRSTRDLERELDLALPPEPIHVDADELRLVQVFGNLLGNARKFTRSGGRIRMRLERRGRQAVVAIEDDGIGIAPEDRERIFDMFAQARRSHGGSRAGLGIGLALVKQLVRLHDGHVEAQSDGHAKGSCFTVVLPTVE